MKLESTVQQKIRTQLEKSATELQGLLLDQLKSDQTDGEISRGGNDSGDEAMQMADIEMEMTQTSRTGYQLELTHSALRKLDTGIFGECEDCGDDISLERILANPISKRCVHCQTKHENNQTQKDMTPSL